MSLLSVPGYPSWRLYVRLEPDRLSAGLRLVARLVPPPGFSVSHRVFGVAYRSPDGGWYGADGADGAGPAELLVPLPFLPIPPGLREEAASLLSEESMLGLLLSLEVMSS